MSDRAIYWALDQTPETPIQKLILVVIAQHHNDETGVCFPSQNTIARGVGCSRSTVQANLEILQHQGFLKITERDKRQSSIYELLICPLEVDRQPVNGGPTAGQQVDREPVTNIYIDNNRDIHSSGPTAGQPMTESRSTPFDPAAWEPDENLRTYCRMQGIPIDDELVAQFRLKISDWFDKGYYSVNLRTKFLDLAKGKQNGLYKQSTTIESELADDSFAELSTPRH